MLRRLGTFFAATLFVISAATMALSQETPATPPVAEAAPLRAQVEATPAINATSIQLRFAAPVEIRTLTVDATLKSMIASFKAGDRVDVVTDNPKDPKKIVSITIAYQMAETQAPFVAVFGSMIALLAILFLMMQTNPLQLILGEDGRYSKSKAQLALWTLSLLSVYLGTVGLRWCYLGGSFIGGVEIPTNLLLLSGLSAFSFAAAKAITTNKIDQAPNAKNPVTSAGPNPAPAAVGVPPVSVKATPSFRDLVQNDKGDFDLGDTQMVLITLIAVVLFVVDGIVSLQALAIQGHVMLPDVDSTLLSAFGLGQGAYLFKKAAGNAGET